jgi:hypothetical protein
MFIETDMSGNYVDLPTAGHHTRLGKIRAVVFA